MISLYCGCSALAFLFLSVVWRADDLLNIFIKVVLWLLCISASICGLMSAGIIIKS